MDTGTRRADRKLRTITLDASGLTETVRDEHGHEHVVGHAPGPGIDTLDVLAGTATLATLEEREEQEGQSTFPKDSPLAPSAPFGVSVPPSLAKRLNAQREDLGKVMRWYRSQPPHRRAGLRHTTIRQGRTLSQQVSPALAVARAPRESRGKPTRTRGSRRTSSRAGPSDDPGEPEPGPRSGQPLLFLAHPRYGKVSRALAAHLRRISA
jgi:hypothetical protein